MSENPELLTSAMVEREYAIPSRWIWRKYDTGTFKPALVTGTPGKPGSRLLWTRKQALAIWAAYRTSQEWRRVLAEVNKA